MNWGPAALIVGGYLVSLLFQFRLTDGLGKRIDDVNKRLDDCRSDLNKRLDDLRSDLGGRMKALEDRLEHTILRPR